MTSGDEPDSESVTPRSWLVNPISYATDRRREQEAAGLRKKEANRSPVETTVGKKPLPPVVVVPAHPSPGGRVDIELATLKRGAVVVAVFSNVQKLIDQLGNAQPWMMVPSGGLMRHLAGHEVTTVVLDPAPGVLAPRWSAKRVRLLSKVLAESDTGGVS